MRSADADADLDPRQASLADTGVKALIPFERPFLDYVLSALADAGYRRVCLVTAPDDETIRRYYTEEAPPERVRIEFAVQQQPDGTADAVLAAESFAGSDPFLVINSDTYYPMDALRDIRVGSDYAVALFEQESLLSGGNIDEDRLRQFAVGRIDDHGFLRQILEKPDEETLEHLPRPLWLSINCWRFGPAIFEACRRIKPSSRGELEIPDAVRYAIDVLDVAFRVVLVRAPVLDLTCRSDVRDVAARLKGMEVRP